MIDTLASAVIALFLLSANPSVAIADATIKGPDGRAIVRIEQDGEKQIAYDVKTGRVLGWYNPATNITSNAQGRPISQGNALLLLAPR